ncbi:class I SAM-dependent methyltransferase [Microbacterium sp. DT81.1]|uniref:class I SAM-dependent methyltransferase n=1 Tax=Microbacterium sp. DT81.1 TaxID=3393413 RepID=UPI003CF564AB
MVDGADESGWSDVAAGWAELWGDFAGPARRALMDAADIGPGTRVLDVGCGSGEFLALLRDTGASAVGADPAPAMVGLARRTGVEVVVAGAESLPFDDGVFEVVTAVNALQFAADTTDALHEFARVVGPGGLIAVSNWAEGARNDVDVIEAAVASALEDEPRPDGPLRSAGGLEAALRAASLELVAAGIVDAPWHAADEDTLVRGILLGEDEETIDELKAVVTAAAEPFGDGSGGYVLHNAFRWAVARAR